MDEYADCISYINDYWKHLTVFSPHDHKTHIGLPNPYVAPSPQSGVFGSDQFYWDSYFIILGLIADEQVELAEGMVKNFAYLFKKYGIIPSRNRFYNLGISQMPLFSSMVREVYALTGDNKWLEDMVEVIEKELQEYWMNSTEACHHLSFAGLSRYCDHHVMSLTSEHESGWDMTSRFSDRCLDFLPVDLNSGLYKYEEDLAFLNGGGWHKKAGRRRVRMNELMWDDDKGFFFDYDYQNNERNIFFSLAGFYPLWAGLATEEQAVRVKEKLPVFECEGGLANTQRNGLLKPFRQHDYPNGWPQQHWIVFQGLLNYGFVTDAKRIARKWLDMNKAVFERTNKFWEKYNVEECCVGLDDRYAIQEGFGWTNAVFLKMVEVLEAGVEAEEDIG